MSLSTVVQVPSLLPSANWQWCQDCCKAVKPSATQKPGCSLSWRAASWIYVVGFAWHTQWNMFFLSYPMTGSRPVLVYDSPGSHNTTFPSKPGEHCSGVGIQSRSTENATHCSVVMKAPVFQRNVLSVDSDHLCLFLNEKHSRRDSKISPEIWKLAGSPWGTHLPCSQCLCEWLWVFCWVWGQTSSWCGEFNWWASPRC